MTLENWAEIGRLIKLTPSRDEVLAIFGVVKRDFHDASLNGLSSDQASSCLSQRADRRKV